jgi:glycine/D-amino acid oxidase-like deaminating enzyme
MRQPLYTIPSDEALPKAADVVVVGGGIVGVSATYWLAKQGVSVALVEKGVVAGEQSSRNWGWCRQQGRDRREIPLIRDSVEMWAGMDREIGVDVGFHRAGVAYVSNDPQELAEWEEWVDHARGHQVNSHMLCSAQVANMLPGSRDQWGAVCTRRAMDVRSLRRRRRRLPRRQAASVRRYTRTVRRAVWRCRRAACRPSLLSRAVLERARCCVQVARGAHCSVAAMLCRGSAPDVIDDAEYLAEDVAAESQENPRWRDYD